MKNEIIYKQGMANFQTVPDEMILKKVLNCFNMKQIECNKIISKEHLCEYEVMTNLENIIPELSLYYYSRRINYFFYDKTITFSNGITILRNILPFFGYNLLRKECISNKCKTIYFTICKNEITNNKNQINFRVNRKDKFLIEFD